MAAVLHKSNFRYYVVVHLFSALSAISENITVNHILPKTRFFGLCLMQSIFDIFNSLGVNYECGKHSGIILANALRGQ